MLKLSGVIPNTQECYITSVIYNNPATIVFWNDGTKTVSKANIDAGDFYNPEVGLLQCIIKKMKIDLTGWIPEDGNWQNNCINLKHIRKQIQGKKK